MRKRVLVGLVVVTLLVIAAAGVLVWRAFDRSAYSEAVATMPASTLRATYTDWAQVRKMAGGTTVAEDAAPRSVDAFLRRAYDQDLTSTSSVTEATYAMHDLYGFSPLEATWEMYGQSREGAVTVMELPDSVDLAEVEENLRDLGYQPPSDGAGSGGVWAGDNDLITRTDLSLTVVMHNVAVLHDERLVVLSDNTDYAATSADVVTGDAPSLEQETEGVENLVEVAEEPVSAVLFAADFACEALSMSNAGEEEQALAEQLVDEAGEVSPLAGMVMALQPDHSMLVGMYFETSEQAEENLETRVELASGEAVGQGGDFADRFRVASGEQSGNTVVLDLQPVGSKAERAESTMLSDLSQGPLLFATC